MNASTEITLSEFVQKHGIKFEAHRVSERPDGLMNDAAGQRHFHCRITSPVRRIEPKPRSFSLYFSQGSAHTELPTVEEVLDCLAMDASTYEGNKEHGFVEWAMDLGYDIDSRAAEKIYKTVKRQANQLKRVLGNEAYQELLYNTERL